MAWHRKRMKVMRKKLIFASLLVLSAIGLSGCIKKITISGQFCDLYERVNDTDSAQVAGNNAIYDCVCLHKEEQICKDAIELLKRNPL